MIIMADLLFFSDYLQSIGTGVFSGRNLTIARTESIRPRTVLPRTHHVRGFPFLAPHEAKFTAAAGAFLTLAMPAQSQRTAGSVSYVRHVVKKIVALCISLV